MTQQQIQHLLNQSHTFLDQVLDHPAYHSLLERGFVPESTIFHAQKSIVFLQLEIICFTEKFMDEQLVDVIANAKIQASKKIAQYIVLEVEKQGFSLADILYGFSQVALDLNLEDSAKFLENVADKAKSKKLKVLQNDSRS